MRTNPPSPARYFPVIRVFVSSTFSDLVAERNALAEKVWPELEKYCRQRGFTFQAIDLRWGVPSEAGLDHRTMQICFEELHRAQDTSPEPNFLILLGDKYGWRPLPETISEAEYTRLHEHTQSPAEQRTLGDWYRRDGNAIPPHHILRARTDSPDGQDYAREADANGRLRDTDAWLAVQETLWAIVNRAYPGSLLPQRFAGGADEMPSSVRFQGSATEQEIWHGALRVENARDHVVAWYREIDRSGGDPDPSQLKHFLDLRPDQSPDPDAAVALSALKTQVEQKLAPEPILHARCRWATDASGAFTGQVTTDHLAPMCETILTRLRTLILRQINDYWKADLSADDATAATVQASSHALDLELRDHQRFAQERGPVDRFVGRDDQVRTLRDYLQSTTNRPLIVYGPSGSGKTALLAYVAQQPFPPSADTSIVSPLILTRFIGAHPESSTLRGLMTSLCRELRVHFPIAEPFPDTLQKLIEEFYAQLGRASAGQPIFVLLDALDQLATADQARECFWLRAQSPSQGGELPCHARIVATCLSPSPEFPAESEACEPFRRLQSRGLLVDEELGALREAAAGQLLRRWLEDQQRGLTTDQWRFVDEGISGASACRHPLYLQVLHEQLRGWREFDEPTPFPGSLPLLIQETLEQLCQPNQHGELPRIALGYLVSARYGLSEGELLEVLFRDPEMQAQLEASGKAYGHRLPPEADHYPIAPWARLRSDLLAYLSERAAPGTTVLSCYHRQVEQAVRTMFLADEATRVERRLRLADYFDDRWDQPDAHALMELPDLLLVLPDHQRLYDRLTDFAFPMRKAEVGLLESIADHYTRLYKEAPDDLRAPLAVWQSFFRENAHILRRGVEDQTVHKILLQLALEHADDSPVTTAAERWLSTGRCDWLRLQRVPRPEHSTPNPSIAVLEGHTDSIRGALVLPGSRILSWSDYDEKMLRVWDASTGACLSVLEGHSWWINGAMVAPNGQIISWSRDKTLRLWDAASGSCLAVLQGHAGEVNGAFSLADGRILSWSDDKTLRLWDVATGSCLSILEGHKAFVSCALLLPEERVVSWSLSDPVLRIWDIASGGCLVKLEGHTSGVGGAQLLPDGRILSWSWSDDQTLRLWDSKTATCLAVLAGHTSWIQGAQVLSEGRILSWGSSKRDTTFRLWDSTTGACLSVLKDEESGWRLKNHGVEVLPDGRTLTWRGTTLRLSDATTGVSLDFWGNTNGVVGALSLPDNRILSWAVDGTLRLWDARTGHCLGVLKGHAKNVKGALLLPNGRFLTWSDDKTLRLWDNGIGTYSTVRDGHEGMVVDILLLSGNRFLSWAFYNTFRLWDASTGACLEKFHKNELPEGDLSTLSTRYPELSELKLRVDRVVGDWCASNRERTAELIHGPNFPRILRCAWQAESDCKARLLQPDGTLVVTQDNGQVCILKLHHGNRRVSLAEAEEILRSGGK